MLLVIEKVKIQVTSSQHLQRNFTKFVPKWFTFCTLTVYYLSSTDETWCPVEMSIVERQPYTEPVAGVYVHPVSCVMCCLSWLRSAFFERGGSLSANISEGRGIAHQPVLCQKTRLIAIWCGMKISAMHHLVLSQYTIWPDRRTDRIVTAIPCIALHAVAR